MAADADTTSLADATIHTRDGTEIKLADTAGHWLLINYWATWCAACTQEHPALTQLSHDPRLRVIGLSDETISPDRWNAFRSQHDFTYPVALVDKAALPQQIPPSAYFLEMRPISYLITPTGLVARRFLGTVTQSEVQQALDKPPH